MNSVHFPGAVDSKFTTQLNFERPSNIPAIPTYRVMDSDGVVVDQAWNPDVSDAAILMWYKNMLTGTSINVVHQPDDATDAKSSALEI